MRNYLVAPGGAGLTCDGEILSTYLRGADMYCSGEDGYDGSSGTSMAAPFVSGVAAMLVENGLSNSQIISCILSSTDDLGTPGRDAVFGYGRLNAAEAVSC
jgi:subtilisin family serine protease